MISTMKNRNPYEGLLLIPLTEDCKTFINDQGCHPAISKGIDYGYLFFPGGRWYEIIIKILSQNNFLRDRDFVWVPM